MNEQEEAAYILGQKSLARELLSLALKELNGEDLTLEGLIAERVDAIATLRRVCRDLGDNDWPDNLHLSDIMEKHLIRSCLDHLAEIEKLEWKLAQTEEERNAARSENERLNAQLGEWQEWKDTSAGYV